MNFSFPFTYSSKVEFPYSKGIDYKLNIDNIFKDLSDNKLVADAKLVGNKITFEYTSVFNISYQVTIDIVWYEMLSIRYEIKFQKLIQISIILVLFTAFFSSFGMSGFLWFSLFLLIAFYITNILFANSGIRNLIKSTELYKSIDLEKDTDNFSEEQKKWMLDISKCPACGEHLQIFGKYCPECGLRLPHPSAYRPFDVSKYKNKKIKYKYKQKSSNVS